MNSKFDAYEIIGVITPGSLLLFGLTLLFPDLSALFFTQGFSVGELGLFLVLSFVAGHLIQAIGNLLEGVIWKPFGGMPTDWITSNPQKLLHNTQLERLKILIKKDFNCDINQLSREDWTPIVREIYAIVQANLNTGRIDSFNRTYGLMRGITATFVTLTVIASIVIWPAWKPILLTILGSIIAGYRMIRFGKGYGRELIITYLRTEKSDSV